MGVLSFCCFSVCDVVTFCDKMCCFSVCDVVTLCDKMHRK